MNALGLYEEDHCFVCGTQNPIGLHLTFQFDSTTGITRAAFVPGRNHQGYDGVVHGGILASILDDAMANCLWLRGIPAVTAKMELRYREPVPVGEHLLIHGRLVKERTKLAHAESWIATATGVRLVEATGTFVKLPQQVKDSAVAERHNTGAQQPCGSVSPASKNPTNTA